MEKMKHQGNASFGILAAVCVALITVGGCNNRTNDNGSPPSESSSVLTAPPTLINTVSSRPASSPSTQPAATTAHQTPKGTPGKVVIAGKVTDAGGSAIATTVSVVLTSLLQSGNTRETKVTSTTAEKDGSYRLEIESRFGLLVVSADGFLPMGGQVSFDFGNTAPEPVIVRDFALQRASEISGRVVDAAGMPLEADLNALWTIAPPSLSNGRPTVYPLDQNEGHSTPSDGFRLFVAPGEVKVTVSATGFAPIEQTITAPAKDLVFRLGDGAMAEGVVLELGSRAPVSSATVLLTPHDTKKTVWGEILPSSQSRLVTDARGAFSFAGLANGTYELSAQGEKLYAWTRPPAASSLTIADGASTSGLELLVFPGYTVSGCVTDKDIGAPIGGVELTHRSLVKSSAKSDAKGQYRLFPVLPGKMMARKEGYRVDNVASAQTNVPGFDNSGAYSVEINLADKLEVIRDFAMAESITVSGRVTRKNGDLIPDAKVCIASSISPGLMGEGNPVKPDGTFSLEVQPNTEVRVKASAPGHAIKVSEVIAIGDQSVTGVEIIMDGGGTLSGVVVDHEGKPVPDAEVTAVMWTNFKIAMCVVILGTTKSDSEGRFVFFNMPSEGATLKAKKKGYVESIATPHTVAEGATRNDLRIELRKPHFIAGRVMDVNKKPVAGAYLSFNGGALGEAISDTDGNYRVEGLAEGEYWASCTPPAGIPGDEVIKNQVAADRDDVDFVVGKKDILKAITTFKVLDFKSRQPIRDFNVSPMQDVVKSVPDKPGEFRVASKQVEYSLTVSAQGYQPLTQKITSNLFWPKQVEFLLGPGGTVIGRVVSKADKVPIAGARLTLMATSSGNDTNAYGFNGTIRNAVSMADGQFVFENAATGSMQVEVQAGGGKAPARTTINVEHAKVADTGDIVIGSGD